MTVAPVRPSPSESYRPSRLMRTLLKLGDRLAVGHLRAVLPDGSVRHYRGRHDGPSAEIRVHDDRLARRFLIGGALGFSEAYLDGYWSSPDVEGLLVYFLLNQDHIEQEMRGRPWVRALNSVRHWLRPNSRVGAQRNIEAHYDLGNAFYEAWLDPSMTYSSALYHGTDDLTAAQMRKYAALCDKLALGPDTHLLEIGCGWGGFAEYAAGERGARVTGITISPSQYAFARERIQKAGLADRVDIRLQDYRDVTGQYDRVASIEMFEAVGEAYWPTFFATVRERLKPGGTAGLQIITIADRLFDRYRRSVDFIQRYVFPGGMLPSADALDEQCRKAGLSIVHDHSFGRDYARTLRDWNARFQQAWPSIRHNLGFDERFRRLWEHYLDYCAAGFHVGTIDVKQITARRD